MNGIIDRRFSPPAALALFLVMMSALCVLSAGPLRGADDMPPGDFVTDPLGVASFIPPQGWIRWDYWGIAAFSPTTLRTPRMTFTVTPGDFSSPDHSDRTMRAYVNAFSTENYTLIQEENLYLDGWSGVRILAQGTEKNALFDRDYFWIQEYVTKDTKISLVFRCEPASFETYRDGALTSFRSLVIRERTQSGQ